MGDIMMRRLVGLAWISIVLSAVPTAEAGFRWLGDWEFTRFGGGSEFSAGSNPSGHFVYLSASASYPGDEMAPDESAFSAVAISRSFEITDAPAGLPATFSVDWTASVDYLPRTHGHAEAAARLSGVVDFDFVATPMPYGYGQGFNDGGFLETRLGEGIYSLSATSSVGFDIGPGANFAGQSSSRLAIQLTVVPEPDGALPLALGGILLGAARLAKRGAQAVAGAG